MRELITSMAIKNIGSLCLFLKNQKNIDYLNFLNSEIDDTILDRNLPEKIYYFVNKIDSILLCKCGEHLSFIGFKNGYRTSCGKKECYVNNRKNTCLKKYGVDNPKKSKDIIDKERNGIIEKWGKHYMMDTNIRSKFRDTMVKNWGVEWAQQSDIISNKSKLTFNNNPNKDEIIKKRSDSLIISYIENGESILLNRYNSIIEKWGRHYMLDDGIKRKMEKNSIEKWGVNHPLKNTSVINKRIESYKKTITKNIENRLPHNIQYISRDDNDNKTDSYIKIYCNICSSYSSVSRQLLYLRCENDSNPCLICNPILHGKSQMELELLEFIKSNYNGEIISNIHSIIEKELDIYIPDLNLAFEFNGLYWHSEIHKERKYHLDKTNLCLEKGIFLFHIWEDDWIHRQDIIKSMILNKLGQTANKIFARKTEIRVVEDNILIRRFLNNNHIQGFVGSKIKIGLFFNEELVSIVTFGNLRKSLGQKSHSGSYELLRFCNKKNTNVVGGASKLFRYFLNNYNCNDIVSYSDISRSTGNMYQQLGFKLSHNSDPNYYYVIDGVRIHRFNFRKDKLVSKGFDPNKTEIQIMNESGYYRIFDCGMQKWIYNI